jgi:hypothetical protein
VSGLGRILVVLGLVLAALGVLLSVAPRSLGWIGRLPGDFRVERGGFRMYFPLATSLVVSLALTVLLRLLGRR